MVARHPVTVRAVVAPPGGRDTRTALLARFRAAYAEQQLREAAIELWETNGDDIMQVHRITGLARSTIYRLLRATGYEPTYR